MSPSVRRYRKLFISRNLLWGAFHVFWSGGSAAASLPIEEVGPAIVSDTAFEGEQSVGVRIRHATRVSAKTP